MEEICWGNEPMAHFPTPDGSDYFNRLNPTQTERSPDATDEEAPSQRLALVNSAAAARHGVPEQTAVPGARKVSPRWVIRGLSDLVVQGA